MAGELTRLDGQDPLYLMALLQSTPDTVRQAFLKPAVFTSLLFDNTPLLVATKSIIPGTSLAAQWLRLHAYPAGGLGSIPGQGTKIPHATQHSQKIK